MKLKISSAGCLLGCLLALILWVGKGITAQNPIQIQSTTVDPTGQTCESTRIVEKIPDGKLYTCKFGVMAQYHGRAFQHVRSFTIDHTQVSNTDQANFPVLWRSPAGTVNTSGVAVTLATGDLFPTWLDAIDVAGTTYSFTQLTPTTGTLGASAGTQTGAAYSGTPYLKTAANGGLLQNASGFDAGWYTSVACTTKVNWELVSWSATTGAAEWWMMIPVLSHTTDTVIYLCYDNSTISTDQSNRTGTWDSFFTGVYHYPNGTSLSQNDSTSNGYNGAAIGSGLTAGAGKIDGALAGTGSGYSDTGNGQFPLTNSFTFECWANLPTWTALQGLIGQGLDGFGNGWNAALWIQAGGSKPTFGTVFGPQISGPDNPFTSGTWHHLAGTYDAAGIGRTTLYQDGSFIINSTGLNSGRSSTKGIVVAAVAPGGSLLLNGTIDEVRISNVPRSADWISTEYVNQSAPFLFSTIGPQI